MNPHPPALFLDRDGIINHEIGWLHRPEDVSWVDGIFDLCRAARALGLRTVVITNQAGIGRGLYTEADFQKLMQWMREAFRAENTALDAVYHCPFHPEHALGDFLREHPDRKPGPGMLLRAAADLSLDLTRSLLVGDRCTDLLAAEAAGVPHRFLLAGTEPHPCPSSHTLIHSLHQLTARLASLY